MKPRLLSFRELQAELRNLSRESKKFSQTKPKKTLNQVHAAAFSETSQCNSKGTPITQSRHNSELSELTELVKRLALSQEEQMARLSRLETNVTVSSPVTAQMPPPFLKSKDNAHKSAGLVCYRCGKPGHVSRLCRTILPEDGGNKADNVEQGVHPLNS